MGRLSPTEAVTRSSEFGHAVLSFVGDDGYPMSLAAGFTADAKAGRVVLDPVAAGTLPRDGQEVGLTFSHIRPQPGIGYDERRYVNAWGRAQVSGGHVTVSVQRATGWDEHETPFFEYCERGVPRGSRYFDSVGARPRLGLGWLFLLATRLPFLTATWVPVALGGAIASVHGSFDWGGFWLAFAGGSAIHLALNIANDIFDDRSGADRANVTPTPFSGGSRVIQYGLVSRRAMIVMCTAFYATGIGIGVMLAESRGRWLYVIGGIGLLVSLFYTAPPLRLVHRGLGEPAVAVGFGPITALGTYYVLTGSFDWEPAYASLPVALLIALILYVNEIPDRAGDAAAGKRTLPVRWSREAVIRGFDWSVIAAYALTVAGAAIGLMPVWSLGALATIPVALKVHRGLVAHYDRPYELMPAMQWNIVLHFLTGALLVIGYVVERFA